MAASTTAMRTDQTIIEVPNQGARNLLAHISVAITAAPVKNTKKCAPLFADARMTIRSLR